MKNDNIKKELIPDKVEQSEPKPRSESKRKSAKKASTTAPDSSSTEESQISAVSSLTTTNSAETETAQESAAPKTSEIVTESKNIENNITAKKISEQPIKEEPNKSENSVEEYLEDISLIDLTDADNIEKPTIEITESVGKPDLEIRENNITKRTSRVSFANLAKSAEIEGSIDDIEAPSFNASVLKTPKSVKIEVPSNEGMVAYLTTPGGQRERLSETFSPVVDVSINDSRPNIDQGLSIVEPVVFKSIASRTSTPFASKPMTKISSSHKKRATTSSFAAKVNESIMVANPLEKSILKSSRRQRSMSVHDLINDHVQSKRVMFVSPQFMEISKIDEKMMASFIGEKENSIMKTNPRQRRSQSAGPSSDRVSRVRKVPDFKAIHENNFNKMESIGEHVSRKADRAKKLLTPEPKKAEQKLTKIPGPVIAKPVKRPRLDSNQESKKEGTLTNPEPKKNATSMNPEPKKIATSMTPKRKPLALKQEPVLLIPKVEMKSFITKPLTINKFVGTTAPAKKPALSNFEANRIKVEERRERNMSLYKTNHVQRATNDTRQKNMTMLKGVRLNRRFELQMQQRHNTDKGNP